MSLRLSVGKKSNKNVIHANKSVSFNKCTFQVRKKIKLTLKNTGLISLSPIKKIERAGEKLLQIKKKTTVRTN